MTKSEAGQVVAILRAHYPGWRATAETVRTWAECLVDLPYEAACAAVKRVVLAEEREFPPPIARIRREVATLAEPALALTAEEAWGEVQEEIRRVGWCGSPRWSHPQIAAAVEVIGWRALCLSGEGDGTTRAHFLRVFAACQARAREQAVLPPGLRLALPTRPEDRAALPAPEPRRTDQELEGNRTRLREILVTLGLAKATS